jgi:hypothetical protein
VVQSLSGLKKIRNLQTLNLEATGVTEAGIKDLKAARPEIRISR